MSYIKPEIPSNLDVNSVTASAGFTGSFIGDGSGLQNIPSGAVDLSAYATLTGVSGTFVSNAAATASLAFLTASNTFTGVNTFNNNIVIGDSKILHGYLVSANGARSHAQGQASQANGVGSYSQGNGVTAGGDYSHAEGLGAVAIGFASHAEGNSAHANSNYSHAEGDNTVTNEQCSHAEGSFTTTYGYASHAEGLGTITSASYQHVQGKYNATSSTALALIGNGTADNARSNILEVYSTNIIVSGGLNVTGGITGSISASTLVVNNLTASNLSASSVNVDYIDFNTTLYPTPPPPPATLGRIFYNAGSGDLSTYLDTNGLYLNNGQQLVQRIHNANISPTLTKGTVVHITGSTNAAVPRVTKADWSNDSGSANTLGIVMSDIALGDEGYVLVQGVIDYNTNAWGNGDIIYLSGSGGLSNVKPIAPKHTIVVGQVVTSKNDGLLYVSIQNGYELGELHDVKTNGKTNGELLIWDSSIPAWKNSSTLNGYTFTGINTFQNAITGSSALFTGSLNVSTSISASQITGSFSGSGALINNITASNINNFTSDVRNQFTAGANISIDYNTGIITASAGTTDLSAYAKSADVTSSFARLTASNTFTADQTITGSIYVSGSSYYDVSSSNPALRITQRGAGTALRVEDSTNPDSSPFIVDSGGNVIIGQQTPYANLTVVGNVVQGSNLQTAQGVGAHAEGDSTKATGTTSHAEGATTLASGIASHAEGQWTTASANYSHAEGLWTIASASHQHVQGKYNATSTTALMLVGNGTADNARSNILEVYTGSVVVSGSLNITGETTFGGGIKSSISTKTSNYPLTASSDYIVAFSGSNLTGTLPAATNIKGTTFIAKNLSATPLFITASSGQIDGSTTGITLASQYEKATFISDNFNWYTI